MPCSPLLYANLSDSRLFQLVKQDDIKAFEELYNRYWTDLIDAAYRRLQSRQKAEDIIQDIFVSLYQKRHTLDINVSLKAYLYQALKFKVLNVFRDEFTRSACRKEIFFSEQCKNDSAEYCDARELNSRIGQILSALPDKCREAFLLSREQNLSNKDISAGMNISVSTVEKHVGKALRILRNNLREYTYLSL
ncbi:MAG: RNA polymerase sigma-70 factor [Candidatus Pseudobacter hemicellulosilyticus]|uniref:RNA polymerase sigma-70 factor n=1 Tax=Candidatus Pseudobacter hemicellulosilyticus TaxID=3121375 RepID=A0AAJ6BFU6_9BACT|nr:MAG: RNA polymerase sigma-70 factor [Pseudobacter sp.]